MIPVGSGDQRKREYLLNNTHSEGVVHWLHASALKRCHRLELVVLLYYVWLHKVL